MRHFLRRPYLGHCLMENRHGLVVASEVAPVEVYGERAAAVRMAHSLPGAHPEDAGSGQGLRRQGFRGRSALFRHHAACEAEHPGPPRLRHRWPHRSPSGLQPVDQRQEANRAGVQLDQTGCRAEADQGPRAITGGGGVPAACGGAQPDPPGESAQSAGGTGMKGTTPGGRWRSSVSHVARKPGSRAVEAVKATGHELRMIPTAQRGESGLELVAISAAS